MNKLCIVRAVGILFLLPLIGSSVLAQNVQTARELTVEQMLNNMAEAFRQKVHPDYSLAVQLDVKPPLAYGYVDTSKQANPGVLVCHDIPRQKSSG